MPSRLGLAALLAALPALMSCGPKLYPACKQADLRAPDGGATTCSASRFALICHWSDGSGELCISDDPTGCHGPSQGCQNQCHDDEFGVGCTTRPTDLPDPDMPSGCRTVANPPGGQLMCCPCQ